MKKLLLALITLISLTGNAQCIMNCANFCVLSINNLDTTANTVDVTIYNGDSCAVNYPTIVVVDALGDTVVNNSNYFYLFADAAGDTTTQTLSTQWNSIPVGFTGTVYYTDQVWDTTCAFSYPMACTLGINEYTSNSELSIYPNPASDVININLEGIKDQYIELSLYDVTGRKTKYLKTSEKTFSISRGDLPDGIYFVEVVAGEKVLSKKVILK
ncbi:MAG: T9SS type A sorting domain-containing protein [Bacteroidia bacterium]